ncbi:MAG TPA: hypothetical protein VJ032_06915 [Thermoanaerobaculia bacterium]|nr:hypothetical protein [Thermoanaerobaculia bacterium]
MRGEISIDRRDLRRRRLGAQIDIHARFPLRLLSRAPEVFGEEQEEADDEHRNGDHRHGDEAGSFGDPDAPERLTEKVGDGVGGNLRIEF